MHKNVRNWRKPLDKEIGDLRYRLQEGARATLEELVKLGMKPHEAKFHASMFMGDMDSMAEAAKGLVKAEHSAEQGLAGLAGRQDKEEAEGDGEPELIPILRTPDDQSALKQTTRDLVDLDRIKKMYGADSSS